MTVSNRTPQNTNLLQPTKYLLSFNRIPATQYFCQAANIPGITLGQAVVDTPFLDYYAAGNKLTYNTFNITFLLDEQLLSWRNLHDWFRSIAAPSGFDERNQLQAMQNNIRNKSLPAYSDGSLTILSNLNNPTLRVQFYNMFPISLSDISFGTTESADNIMTADASFIFMYHEFVPA